MPMSKSARVSSFIKYGSYNGANNTFFISKHGEFMSDKQTFNIKTVKQKMKEAPQRELITSSKWASKENLQICESVCVCVCICVSVKDTDVRW